MATKKVVKKRPPKTVKEKKFVKAYIENGGNGVKAALESYDTDNYGSANRIAQDNVQKLSFDHYFAAAGLTDKAISENIANIALRAKRIHGTDSDFIEVDDNPTRLKATELAIKVMGKFAPPKAPVDPEGNTVVPILMGLSITPVGDSEE